MGKQIRSKAVFLVAVIAVFCIALAFCTRSAYAATTAAPGKVTGLKKTYQGHYDYKLTWDKASNAKSYQVYRATTKTGKYSLVKTVTSRSYTAYVTPGKQYYYKVRGVRDSKKGSFSSIITVKTAAVNRLAAGIPKYWNEEINNAVKTFKNTAGQSTFLYFTDSHWAANTQHSPAIISYLYDKLNFPFVVFGGDVIAGTYEKTKDAIAEVEDFYGRFDEHINIMSTTGNHDYNTSSGDIAPLTEKKVYELIYKREKQFATVAQYGRCAYTDDTANKVRYISMYFDAYLDNEIPQMGMDYGKAYPSQSELDWLKATVQDSRLDKNWTIVLFTHGYWNFVKKGSTPTPTAAGAKFGDYLLNLQADSATKADIGCWLVGHTHRDMSTVIKNDSGKIRIICTNCDTYVDGKMSRDSGYWGGWTMTKGHDTEQVIDMVRIDTVNKKIHLVRVGAGKDRNYSY